MPAPASTPAAGHHRTRRPLTRRTTFRVGIGCRAIPRSCALIQARSGVVTPHARSTWARNGMKQATFTVVVTLASRARLSATPAEMALTFPAREQEEAPL